MHAHLPFHVHRRIPTTRVHFLIQILPNLRLSETQWVRREPDGQLWRPTRRMIEVLRIVLFLLSSPVTVEVV